MKRHWVLRSLQSLVLCCALVGLSACEENEQVCVPTTCAAEGTDCGAIDDGCGEQLYCGTCTAPETCGGGGTPFVCGQGACVPTTCNAQNRFCGPLPDGCGTTLGCGSCTEPATCSEAGQCEPCVRDCEGRECGDDGCGGSCGACDGARSCNHTGRCCSPDCEQRCDGPDGCGGTCPDTCVLPETCGGGGWLGLCGCTWDCEDKDCGDNGCGGVCGACGPMQHCNASFRCEGPCTPDCLGKECGEDGCGGSCADYCQAPETCGGGGEPFLCGCAPTQTCELLGLACGAALDDCGGPLECGACPGQDEICRQGACVFCIPRDCQPGVDCGVIYDGCSQDLDCGECSAGEACGLRESNLCSPICTPDRWCQESRPGTGTYLQGLWGSGPDDLWAFGSAPGGCYDCLPVPLLLRWDGQAWTSATPPGGFLAGIWGFGRDDVWVADNRLPAHDDGRSGVERWDGSSWSVAWEAAFSGITGLWGSGPTDMVVIREGSTLRWDGASWTDLPGGGKAIWGSGPDDIWVVGGGGSIRHWDGSSWSSVESTTTGALRGVWGSGPEDAWAVGEGGTILRWDGATWAGVASPTAHGLSAVWGSGTADAWAVGEGGAILHWEGSSWSLVDSGTTSNIHGVWGSGPGDVWAVGEDGIILRYRP